MVRTVISLCADHKRKHIKTNVKYFGMEDNMGRKMDYVEFQTNMKEQLRALLPESYQVVIQKVVKNNDLQLDSLVILSKNVNISPNFYMQQYYRRYLDGETAEGLISEMLVLYERTKDTMNQYRLDLSLDTCRDKIIYRLISGERNDRHLENVPSIPFLDLEITFYVLLVEEEDGVGSVLIHDDLQEEWHIDTKQLFRLAQENTMRLFPMQIRSMEQVLQELLVENGHMQETSQEGLQEAEIQEGNIDPLVVTNEKGINGAAVMLYPGCLSMLSEHCHGDYYILPSSIHELLILPDHHNIPEQELKKMVREVNENCVQPDEILSDHVYHYSTQFRTVEVM